MWSPMVTLDPVALVVSMLSLYFLFKSAFIFIRYLDPNMVPTDTIGFRVTLVTTCTSASMG